MLNTSVNYRKHIWTKRSPPELLLAVDSPHSSRWPRGEIGNRGDGRKLRWMRNGTSTILNFEDLGQPQSRSACLVYFERDFDGLTTICSQKAALLFGFITLWLWTWLPLFWGSTYKLQNYFHKLSVNYVTFDTDPNSFLNNPMLQEAQYQAALSDSIPHLGWVVRNASEYPNGLADVRQEIYSQKAWATVVVNANATSAWQAALANGDSSYDPTGAVGVYFASARFYQVTLLYLQPLVRGPLVPLVPTQRLFPMLTCPSAR